MYLHHGGGQGSNSTIGSLGFSAIQGLKIETRRTQACFLRVRIGEEGQLDCE